MKTLVKSLVAVFVIVILLIVSIILYLQFFVSADSMKGFITQQLSSATKKSSQINGTLHWRLFPMAGIEVNDIQIGEAKADSDYSANIKRLLLKLEWFPLLHKNLVFSEVRIDGLNAQINANTQSNQPVVKQSTSPAPRQKSTADQSVALQIKQFKLQNSSLRYRDAHLNLHIKTLSIQAKPLNFNDKPIHVVLSTEALLDHSGLKSSASINFDGTVRVNPSRPASTKHPMNPLTVDGKLVVQSIQLDRVTIDRMEGTVQLNHNQLLINPLSANLYQGQSRGLLSLSSDRLLKIKQKASGINAETMLSQLAQGRLASGTMDYAIDISLPLNNPKPLEALSGKGSLNIVKGSLFDINIKGVIESLNQQINSIWANKKIQWLDALNLIKIDPAIATSGNTIFDRAGLNFTIADGHLRTDDIAIHTQHLKVDGNFNINLVSETLSGTLNTEVSSQPANSHLMKIQQTLGGYFPLRISGKIADPIVLPDTKIIAPVIRNYVLKDTIQKHLNKPIKQLGKDLKKLFE